MTDPLSGPRRPTSGPGRVLDVTPQTAGWEYLSFAVHELDADTGHAFSEDGRETAIVPLSGAGKVLKTELRKPFWEGRERQVN